MTHHTVKLPHGYRIECYTKIINRERRMIRFDADVYHGSDKIFTQKRLYAGVKTNGDLIDYRNQFLSDITCRVERRPLPLDAIHTRNRQAFITPE